MVYKNYRRFVKPDAAAEFWSIFPHDHDETPSESLNGARSFESERNTLELSVW
jgi:hypothetical protein